MARQRSPSCSASRLASAVRAWLAAGDIPRRWFNLRPSNTEPLIRLNVEAPSGHDAMTTVRDEVLALVRR